MKTYNMVTKIFKAMSLVAMTLLLANCGKSDSNNNAATAANSGYYVQNNTCYLNGTVQTALSSCQTATSTYYGLYNNVCYQVGANVYSQVAYTQCQTNGVNGYQTCNGTYYGATQMNPYTATAAVTCQEGATPMSTYQMYGNYTQGTPVDCSGLQLATTYGVTVNPGSYGVTSNTVICQ